MNHSPKSTRSLSSDSSTDSIVSSALKTPIDVQEEMAALVDPSSPLPATKSRSHAYSGQMMSNALASRLERLPKRANAIEPTAIATSCLIKNNKNKTLDPRSPPCTTNTTTNATSTRLGRLRSESISSVASTGSQSSALLRATLLMASPSLRNSYHQHHNSASRPRSHSESQSKSHPHPHSRAQSVGHQLPQAHTPLYMRSLINTSRNKKNNVNVNEKGTQHSASGSGPTPSLLTHRTSNSSFASTSLSSPNSVSLRDDSTGVPRRGSHSSSVDQKSIKSSLSVRSRKLSTDIVGALVAADATTAVSTQTSSSLAQFAPTPGAKACLLQFGVQRHERASTSGGLLSISTGRHNVVVTPSAQPVDARRRRSRARSDAYSASSSSGLVRERQGQEVDELKPQFGLQFVTGWFGKPKDLPSISRGLEPDTTVDDSAFGGIQVTRRHHLRSATESMASSIAGKREKEPGFGSGHLRIASNGVEGGALAATPRPAFPINSHTPKPLSQPQSKEKEVQQPEAPRISALDKGKGRARPLSPTLTRHASSPPGDSRIRPDPSSLLSVPKPSTPPSKRNGDLPTLAAIESGSRLMRQKIVCATCGQTGPDFPRCGRCGEAWCSRECRTEANKATGGKHRCCASVA